MMLQITFTFFAFQASLILLTRVIEPSAWFQNLNSATKVIFILAFGLVGALIRSCILPAFVLPFPYQIAMGLLMGLWAAFWIYKSPLFLQNCTKKSSV